MSTLVVEDQQIIRVKAQDNLGSNFWRRRIRGVEGVKREGFTAGNGGDADHRAEEINTCDAGGKREIAGGERDCFRARGECNRAFGEFAAQDHVLPRDPQATVCGAGNFAGQRVESAHKLRDEAGRGAVVNLERGADLIRDALVHDHDPVGHREGFFLVMGYENRGDPEALLDFANFVAQGDTDFRIERRKWFIEQQNLRARREGAGKSHALLLAARELIGVAGAEVRQADQVQHFLDAGGAFGLRRAFDFEAEGDVFRHGEVREQGVGLEHHADVSLVRFQAGHVRAVD